MTSIESLVVPEDKLRWRCDPRIFGAADTRGIDPDAQVIGQDRALKALKLGMELRSPGYNVFVAGFSGTGRMTSIHRILRQLLSQCIEVSDKAYVHNFDPPTSPRLLIFPRGQLARFKEHLQNLTRSLRSAVPSVFESEHYLGQRRQQEQGVQEEQRRRFEEVHEECQRAGLTLVQIQQGPEMRTALGVKLTEEEVVPIEALTLLVRQGRIEKDRAERLRDKAARLAPKLDKATVEARKAAADARKTLEELDRSQVRAAFAPEIEAIRAEFKSDAVRLYLDGIEKFVLEHLEVFRARSEKEDSEEEGPGLEDLLHLLEVNAILERGARDDSPVIIETSPTYTNLFGVIERNVSPTGEVWTDHTRIRAGSLLQADGGFLILNAEEVLAEPFVWSALKRTLKLQRLEIQEREAQLGVTPLLFKPEPIPIQVKVIMIGDSNLYNALYNVDPDFRKTFKVRADFDTVMDLTDVNIRRYGSFISRLSAEEGLLPFGAEALARIVEHGVRDAEQNGKLSCRFSEIADIARESDYFGRLNGVAVISRTEVESALAEARERDGLYDMKLTQRIQDGTLVIHTHGKAVGQVNALTVFESGRLSFGKPARITATIAAGDLGILNIEREVQMSGDIHDKGVLILSSFLRERFGQHHPLSLSASLCFEQNYGGIDGDSASSAELYALLSALADVPISQTFAVTGSVDQKGRIQAIGGLNEKIEGFFALCTARGLEGEHGVIIPRQNVSELMLSEEVVRAVGNGKFRVYGISHIDEGIEILTGMPAGDLDSKGQYPPETISGRVTRHLYYFAEISRDFKNPHPDPPPAEAETSRKDSAEPPEPRSREGS